jgi:hypothetical protein
MRYDDTKIAIICHEAVRGLQIATDDPMPSDPWLAAPEWQKQVVIEGVQRARRVITPREHHEAWRISMLAAGWVWGPLKNWSSDPPTHPNLVAYDDLPPVERDKDELFLLITVWAMGKS